MEDNHMSTTETVAKFNKPADALKVGLKPSPVMPQSLLGTWLNVNAQTRDIVRVVLSETNGVLHVQAFGACVPTPCNWGVVNGLTYSASVSGGPAIAFSANYAFGFKNTILTGHLNGDELIVEDFNVFEDGSGRSAYFTQGTFKKS